MITSKKCRVCGEVRSTMHFNQKLDTRDGYNTTCKDCIRAQRGQRQRKPPKPRAAAEITYETLVQDVFDEEARKPHDFVIRQIADNLREDQYSQDELTCDLLYEMWERRMIYQGHEPAVRVNRRSEERRSRRNVHLGEYGEI